MTSSSYLSVPPGPRPAAHVPAVPETCGVPQFAPLRVRGGRHRLRRAVRRRRRAMAAGLAMTAAALAASASGSRGPGEAQPPRPAAAPEREPRAAELVSAPVRIADGATVRLLRPGDLVDVIASPGSPSADGDDEARVVARGARVEKVPQSGDEPADGGALVVLSVPRATATALAGAGTTSRLAVTLC
ncbi:RcpC/CpaB family pilus assembly protein [Streptomyces sp. WAC05374]|uniref:RcpC/CpaB family pilus assembly protein n=1 Tax=Streptomyces sp. WAC05374 TaxID=2487420 RepID=UPI00135917DD|nr:RcpC/CpaB family pilus assembly protein [Streptomyces sp. WAC05374]